MLWKENDSQNTNKIWTGKKKNVSARMVLIKERRLKLTALMLFTQ